MGTTEPDAYGPTHNPWNLDHSPGGSSGGSAAAVAAGFVPAAHANDIAGSIRIPASQCGLVGLKPTRGRVLPGRRADPAVGMNTEGVLTRTVRDTAGLLDAITDRGRRGPWPAPDLPGPLTAEVGRDPGRLRDRRLPEGVHRRRRRRGVCAAAATTLPTCSTASATSSRRLRPTALFEPDLIAGSRTLFSANAAAAVAEWSARLGRTLGEADVEPLTWQVVEAGRSVSGAEVLAVLDRQHELARRALSWWRGPDRDGFDILLTPATAEPGPPLGAYKQGYVTGPSGSVHPRVQRHRPAGSVAAARLARRRLTPGRSVRRRLRTRRRARPSRRPTRASPSRGRHRRPPIR